jgi:hypothetical protein
MRLLLLVSRLAYTLRPTRRRLCVTTKHRALSEQDVVTENTVHFELHCIYDARTSVLDVENIVIIIICQEGQENTLFERKSNT